MTLDDIQTVSDVIRWLKNVEWNDEHSCNMSDRAVVVLACSIHPEVPPPPVKGGKEGTGIPAHANTAERKRGRR